MKKQFYFLFFLLLLISCNKDCPETFYGIRLGRDSRGEFLKAREKGYIRMNSDGKSLLNITSNIKAEIDYWAEHDINEEGRLTQIDLNFYDGYVIKNSEYLLSGKKSQNEIVKFFEDKYGVIDTAGIYTDLNDESKNKFYSNEVIDIGYGFPKINSITRQWIVDNLKIRLTTQITEDKKYMANATYFYTDKFQNELRQTTLKKSRDNF